MSCFLIPKTICKQISSIMSDYWWRNSKASRGMHWKSWEALSSPKEKGGLGFKDLEAFNIALLGKQLWRMITHPESLFARVFKRRYFRNSDPLNAPMGSRPSYAWRSMHAAQQLIRQGAKVIIGNGRNTNIWQERWLGSKPAYPIDSTKLIPEQYRHFLSPQTTVSDLMSSSNKEVNTSLIRNLFPLETQLKIAHINLHGDKGDDIYS